ncbi:hypothetical protein OG21DRAFT_17984 [Imleria badia]|nr:hypothetical protein OG21DRAFT_17984 [Imleria badia]
MSSLFGLAEQFLSPGAGGGGSSDEPEQPVRKTGGQEYNSPHHGQQSQGGYDTQEVLSHANDVDEDSKGYVENAVRHVHSNPQQHNEEVDEGAMAQYGPMIMSVLQPIVVPRPWLTCWAGSFFCQFAERNGHRQSRIGWPGFRWRKPAHGSSHEPSKQGRHRWGSREAKHDEWRRDDPHKACGAKATFVFHWGI